MGGASIKAEHDSEWKSNWKSKFKPQSIFSRILFSEGSQTFWNLGKGVSRTTTNSLQTERHYNSPKYRLTQWCHSKVFNRSSLLTRPKKRGKWSKGELFGFLIPFRHIWAYIHLFIKTAYSKWAHYVFWPMRAQEENNFNRSLNGIVARLLSVQTLMHVDKLYQDRSI